jgi:hypothetical protein
MSNAVTIFSLPHDAFVFFIQICAWRIGDLNLRTSLLVSLAQEQWHRGWLARRLVHASLA